MMKQKSNEKNRNDEATAYNPLVSAPFGSDAIDVTMRRGCIYIVSGKTGTGKTTLGTQFLIDGARHCGKCAIIVTDCRAAEYISNAKALSSDFTKYYEDGQIEVYALPNSLMSNLKFLVSENPRNFEEYLAKLKGDVKKLVEESNITRLVIDTVTPLLVGGTPISSILISQTINALADTMPNGLMLFTSGVLESELSRFGFEENSASGIIKLTKVREAGEGNAYQASIVKWNGACSSDTFKFKITSKGIISIQQAEKAPLNSLRNDKA